MGEDRRAHHRWTEASATIDVSDRPSWAEIW
ncbi:hypothetical protein ABID74_001329 [Gordonia terrae]